MCLSSSSMPLQDLPSGTLQGYMLSQSNEMNKRKSSDVFLSEGLDMECTPTESIMQFSPHNKYQRLLSMRKENDCNQFVLNKRSRRKKESTSCKGPSLYISYSNSTHILSSSRSTDTHV